MSLDILFLWRKGENNMNNLQILMQLYNSLMQLSVNGENVLILSNCILSLRNVITQMQEDPKRQDGILKEE